MSAVKILSNRFLIVIGLTLITLILPTPSGLSHEGKMALTAFVFTGTIFALQPVPLPFAGLMVSVVLVALGISDSETAFATLSRPIIILILGSLFLAEAMRKHGFDDWCMWTGYESGNKASEERYWDAYVNTPKGSETYVGKFGPDVYTDYLIHFINEHKDEPMMLYFPMALTHGPLTTTTAEPDVKDSKEKFKAMIRYTDRLVGRLCKALDKLRIRERTIIIFTTDNGSGGGHIGNL